MLYENTHKKNAKKVIDTDCKCEFYNKYLCRKVNIFWMLIVLILSILSNMMYDI